MALLSGCVSGAEQVGVVERLLTQAGFEDVQVAPKEDSKTFMADWAPGTPITDYVVSAIIEGRQPTAWIHSAGLHGREQRCGGPVRGAD